MLGVVVLCVTTTHVAISLALGRHRRELTVAEVAAEARAQSYLLQALSGAQAIASAQLQSVPRRHP